MARDLRHSRVLRDMAKHQRSVRVLCQMRSAKFEGTGIVVALNPNPVAPGHQPGQPKRLILRHAAAHLEIIEAVAETDHCFRIGRGDRVFETAQRVECLIRGQQLA